jgi:hypothetical protein
MKLFNARTSQLIFRANGGNLVSVLIIVIIIVIKHAEAIPV